MKTLAQLKTQLLADPATKAEKRGRVLALPTPAEDAAIAAGIGQDPDTYEPRANEIATMRRPDLPVGSGSKTQVRPRHYSCHR
jgi:hypothetical protein